MKETKLEHVYQMLEDEMTPEFKEKNPNWWLMLGVAKTQFALLDAEDKIRNLMSGIAPEDDQ